MIVTILKVGEVPEPLRDRFASYPEMFRAMFAAVDARFDCREVDIIGGAAFPDPETLDAVLITGSTAGVYDDHAWIAALRDFIRAGYARDLPMVGICYGHQAIADALGGVVRKSEKGWGLGRHTYEIVARPDIFGATAPNLSVTCSHQDQVLELPKTAQVILRSDFTPYAGLTYANGKVLSFQPHPEFEDDYGRALAQLRRGRASPETVEAALRSFDLPSDRLVLANAIARFIAGAHSAR